MIILDFSQVMIATLFAQLGKHTNAEIDENMLRHMCLNSIRANKVKFQGDYGELVIAFDSKRSWRKDFFPYYKFSRQIGRDESEIDWSQVFGIIDHIKQDLKEVFPYVTIEVIGAEADDVIGTLANRFGTPMSNGQDDILILSGDKDFAQLSKYGNVRQFNPVQKEWLNVPDPEDHLFRHILNGDKGDDIPNVRSNDTFFVEKYRSGDKKMRQKPILASLVSGWKADPSSMPEDVAKRFEQNKKLICLDYTPDEVKQEINRQYDEQKANPIGRGQIMNYLIKHRMKLMMTHLGDF